MWSRGHSSFSRWRSSALKHGLWSFFAVRFTGLLAADSEEPPAGSAQRPPRISDSAPRNAARRRGSGPVDTLEKLAPRSDAPAELGRSADVARAVGRANAQ